MSVQTFEANTDAEGSIHFADAVRLPAHTRVYVVVPEQTVAYTDIAPLPDAPPASIMNFPFVRVVEEGLAKRLVKTIVEDSNVHFLMGRNKYGTKHPDCLSKSLGKARTAFSCYNAL